jgi:hypothetical protein
MKIEMRKTIARMTISICSPRQNNMLLIIIFDTSCLNLGGCMSLNYIELLNIFSMFTAWEKAISEEIVPQ